MVDASKLKKIVIIGNAGSGKTTLARKLGRLMNLPVTHVDSIQFLSGMQIRPHRESIQMLTEIQNRDDWIIEGYGPLDMIEKRFQAADKIIYIDFPIARHYWWCAKRQLKNAFSQREELPEGCNEFTWAQTKKLYRSIGQEYKKMRPELLRILERKHAGKVLFIRTYSEYKQLSLTGLQS